MRRTEDLPLLDCESAHLDLDPFPYEVAVRVKRHDEARPLRRIRLVLLPVEVAPPLD